MISGGFISVQEAVDFAIHGRTIGVRHNALRRAEAMAQAAWRRAVLAQRRRDELRSFLTVPVKSYETVPSTSPLHPGRWTGD